MIFTKAINSFRNINGQADPGQLVAPTPRTLSRTEHNNRITTASGQRVTPENAKNVATAYRCANIISDDIAKIPLQEFISRKTGDLQRVQPNALINNMAWRLEKRPNRWWSPFLFKKTIIQWLLFYGNAYVWRPSGARNELFILPSDLTSPVFDENGNLWYSTRFPNGQQDVIPDVEMLHLMINSTDGYIGQSVLTYARETIGRQLGAYDSQNKLYSQAFNAAGIIYLNGESTKEIRDEARGAYTDAVSGSKGMARVAVFDNKITKFEPITMKPVDMQFLDGIQATDSEIANFFGMPLHKLNMGKQSYESNSQQQLDYLGTTLDPYLVQWEQAAAIKWLSTQEQGYTYYRFERNAILRINPETRTGYLQSLILNGQLSPNEARQIEDRPAFAGGDNIYMPLNMDIIGKTNTDSADTNPLP